MVVLLFFLFRSEHHGCLRIWTLIALVALQTDFVEKDVRNLDRIVRVRSPIALRASSLFLLPLGLLSVPLLILRLPLKILRSDEASVVAGMKFLKWRKLSWRWLLVWSDNFRIEKVFIARPAVELLFVFVQGVWGERLAAVPAPHTGLVEGSSVRRHEGLSRVDGAPAGGTLGGPAHLTGGGRMSDQSGRELNWTELGGERTPDSWLQNLLDNAYQQNLCAAFSN